ncbi:acyl-CoA dehydrogenase family protein [Actinoplanes sp. NPDC051851]|uniref:acyl-CoA dehydrogenase family protein n=1 Tax=Actinoplanes sp. NPDC051851 TaxID=3154753 RepID=UPI0034199794
MTEERELLREAVRGLVATHPTPATLWSRLCKEIGVAGLTLPPAYDGSGATLLESFAVLEELGRTLTPTPMLPCLLAAEALLLAGDAGSHLLPALCSGDLVATVAFLPDATVLPDAIVLPDATATAEGDRLTGTATSVPNLEEAGTLLVLTGEALFEVPPEGVPEESLDLSRPLSTVHLANTPARRLGTVSAATVRDIAAVALGAEQIGAAARALELTVDYAKTRHQFARPIGSFQAVQHRLADSHVRLQAARATHEAAAEALVAHAPDAPVLAAVAKVTCSEAFQSIAADMTQVHGGIAITWEHEAHRYLRRAWSSAHLFGSPADHITRLSDVLLGQGTDHPGAPTTSVRPQ